MAEAIDPSSAPQAEGGDADVEPPAKKPKFEETAKVLEVAKDAARKAGSAIKATWFTESTAIEATKSCTVDLVTETDARAEAIVIGAIKEHFPSHEIIGEETVGSGKYTLTDAPTWTIDPIDGTTNFVHRHAQSCVIIAFLADREALCGVVYDPIADELFYATKGGGAFLESPNRTGPISVSSTTEISKSLIGLEIGYGRDEIAVAEVTKQMQGVMRKGVRSVRMVGSTGLNLAYTACGRLDAVLEQGSWETFSSNPRAGSLGKKQSTADGAYKHTMAVHRICCVGVLAAAGLLLPACVEARTLVGNEAGSFSQDVAASNSSETEVVQLKDIAIGILSGREEYFNPVASAMLRYAPRGVLLKAEGRCPCNFRAGFAALLKKHPDAKWYYIADDDVIIMLDRLVRMLRAYGEETPRVLAGATMAKYVNKCGGDKEEAPWAKDDPEGHCMYGGTGLIMSGPMARQLNWDQPCKCDILDSDLEMTCFLGRSWNSSFRFEGLHPEKGFGNNPGQNDVVARSPFQQMVIVHHVKASTLADISDRNRVVGDATRTAEEVIADAMPLVGACCDKDKAKSLAEEASHLVRRESK